MGLGSFLSGLPVVGDLFGGLTGETQAEATKAAAGLDAAVSAARAAASMRMFDKGLEYEKERVSQFKEQAAQIGSMPMPALKQTISKEKSNIIPLLIAGAGMVWLYLRKKGRLFI